MTFDDIVNDEVQMLNMDFEGRQVFASTLKEDLIHYHRGYGRFLRNNYGLWHDSPLTKRWREEGSNDMRDGIDYSTDHPDYVSQRLIEAIWEKLQ